jgi:putative PIN family toxin of toxin-antitoxin system
LKRAVFETNVWVSGLVFSGEVRKVILAAVEGRILPVISMEILQELERVLKSRKFSFSPRAISPILYEIQTLAVMAHPKLKLNVIKKDPADNRILECALAGKSDWIVSGDSDLLELVKFRGIAIRSPRDFLADLDGE